MRGAQLGVVGILGMGLVGSALAALLQQGGLEWHPVDDRASRANSIDLWGQRVRLTTSSQRPAEIVFVTTKSFSADAAVRAWAPTFQRGTIVVILCNGLIDEELSNWQRDFPQLVFRRGMVSFGVKELGVGELACVGVAGHCAWGPVEGDSRTSPRPIEKIVIGETKRLHWHDDSHQLAHIKWMLNTALNGVLAANQDCKINGDLLRHELQADACLFECWQFATERWNMGRWTQERVRASLWQLVEDTFQNENSILRDLRTGRRTERTHLCGVISDEPRFPNLVQICREIAKRERA
jgi:ketopantoate reductase